MAGAPDGWFQGPDERWYRFKSGARSPGTMHRAGTLAFGIGFVTIGVGSFIYTLAVATTENRLPGWGIFGMIVQSLGSMAVGIGALALFRRTNPE